MTIPTMGDELGVRSEEGFFVMVLAIFKISGSECVVTRDKY
jgi:hypothetical protein